MPEDGTRAILARDCDAVFISSGLPVRLTAGSEVVITGTGDKGYTVAASQGLLRIDARDADALGIDAAAPTPAPTAEPAGEPPGAPTIEEQLWDALRRVYDPEIPVNIVDLGLVYACRTEDRPEGGKRARIQMTLTAPGCPMAPMIAEDARRHMLEVPGITEADVDIVWDPPWNQEMISEAGRMQLGML